MQISKQKPKCWDRISEIFPLRWDQGVIITYGGVVHTISGKITPELEAHEQVHIDQQAGIDPDEWVERFISDIDFRLAVEIEAFRAQADYLRVAHEHYPELLNQKLHWIYTSISSPLYGNVITYEEAKKLI